MHRVAEYLGGRAEALPWFTIGQVVDLANPEALLTAGLVSSEAAGLAEGMDQVALTPSGATINLPAGEGPRYLPLDEHGFYVVRPPGIEPERPFVMAVNVDVEESNLARIDTEEMAAQLVAPPGDGGGTPHSRSRERTRRGASRSGVGSCSRRWRSSSPKRPCRTGCPDREREHGRRFRVKEEIRLLPGHGVARLGDTTLDRVQTGRW
jgi:hypothetical protein